MSKDTQGHGMISWWYLAHMDPVEIYKCRKVIRLLLNTCRIGRESCSLCMDGTSNNICHILFSCNSLATQRAMLWDQIRSAGPDLLVSQMEGLPTGEKTMFILNGLNCQLIKEWLPLYKALVDFIFIMYTQYEKLGSC